MRPEKLQRLLDQVRTFLAILEVLTIYHTGTGCNAAQSSHLVWNTLFSNNEQQNNLYHDQVRGYSFHSWKVSGPGFSMAVVRPSLVYMEGSRVLK